MKKDIYVASTNIVSPLGFTTHNNMQALLNGKSGLAPIDKSHLFPQAFYGSLIDTESLDTAFSVLGDPRAFTRFEKIAILSIKEALQQTTIDATANDTLFILSTTKGSIDVLDSAAFDAERLRLGNTATVISRFFNNPHTPLVVSNACISGVLAVIIGKRFLQHTPYKNIIVCGADIVTNFVVSGFQSFKALSDTACKPFDKNRKGLNLGEGCGTIILTEAVSETTERTEVIVGPGFSANDATHISAPSRTGDGLYNVIEKILNYSQGTINKAIDFISGHGTATPYNDSMEAYAVSLAGLQDVPLNSFKGYWGHTLGAAGTIETAASVYAMQHGILFKSAGFDELGTEKPVNVIKETINKNINSCLKLASGFGGSNAGILLYKNHA